MERNKTIKLRLSTIYDNNIDYDFLQLVIKRSNWLIFNNFLQKLLKFQPEVKLKFKEF